MQSGKIPDSADYAVRLLGTDGRDLLFELMADEELGLTASIPKEAYDLFAGELHHSPIAEDQPFYVNRSWTRSASEFLNR